MRSIKKIYWNRGLWVTLAFYAWLLEWTATVRSENTKTISEGTFPSHVEMPIGGSANITCRVFNDQNSSMIWFHETFFDKKIRQPHRDILIIDDKTAVLTIHNASKHKFHYTCKVEQPDGQTELSIGGTHVSVGTPPREVKDFHCKAYDFMYMTCTFTRPDNNIYTSYEVNYTDSPNKFCEKSCMDLVEEGNRFTCNLTMRNDSFYVALQEIYYFNITGKNELGSHSQIEVINHFNVVVPAKLNIQLENITINSVILTWQNFKYMYFKNITLDYEILIQPKGLKGYFATDYDYCNDKKCRVLINNLQYAYYDYLLKVRAKAKEAPNIDGMWSEPFEKTFRTDAKRPEYPPATAPGSFYIDSELYLYWKQLQEYEYSGPGFYYAISQLDYDGKLINVTTTKNSMVMLQWDKYEEQISRTYFIKAVNEVGESINSTMIQVFSDIPNREDYKIDFIVEVYQNNTYELSWKPSRNSLQLTNYTIFWCNTKDTKDRCLGSIHFTMIDGDQTSFPLESQNYSLNLAMAANYDNYSTGMIWDWCLESTALIKLEPGATALTANSIKIYWSLEHLCSAVVQGYNLSYCEISDRYSDCTTEPITLKLEGDLKTYTIYNLKPYTTYRIHMRMYSRTKIGPISNAILVETQEAAPSMPRNVSLIKLTSQSATISWYPPEKFNGNLQFYTINVRLSNGKLVQSSIVNATKSGNLTLNHTINDLEDFTDYQMDITAHTIYTSPRSQMVNFKTLIGKLNPPRKGMTIESGNKAVFNWTEPITATGYLEKYEVALVVMRDDNKTIKKIIETKNNKCSFRIPECHGSGFKYSVKVRAVYAANISEVDNNRLPRNASGDDIDDGTHASESLYLECSNDDDVIKSSHMRVHKISPSHLLQLSSSWETAREQVYNCSLKLPLLTTIAVIIIFILIIVLGYGGCTKYKKMNNIDVVLPPGLVDHLAAYKINNNVSYGTKSDKEQTVLSSSNDCLVNNKEKFHLLASLSSSSSSNIPNGIISTIENNDDDRRFNFEDYDNAFHCRAGNSNGSYDLQNSSQSTDSIELNDSSSGTSSNNDALQSTSRLSSKETNQNKVTTIPSFNGYVSIPPKNHVNNGYTTVDKINVFPTTFLQEEESKKNLNDINPNSSNNMYVTPAQLAQIGRSERLY